MKPILGLWLALLLLGAHFLPAQEIELDQLLVAVNSPYDEQAPFFHPDLNTLYFTRSKHPQNTGGIRDQGDIWYSQVDEEGNWSTPSRLEQYFNDASPNSLIGFSWDGGTMLLNNHYRFDGKRKTTQGIAYAKRSGQAWTKPKNVKMPYFKNKSIHQSGWLSRDGKVLLMSMEYLDSRGGEDLYVFFKDNGGKWSEPKNLGFDINTAFQEFTPFLDQDNKTLYFSSNGRGGFGSSDVFVTERLDDSWTRWSAPENIGSEVNTSGRELYFRKYPQLGIMMYVSTTDSDGYGDLKYRAIDDKYIPPEPVVAPEEDSMTIASETAYPTPVDSIHMYGKVLDFSNREGVNAVLTFQGEETKARTTASSGSYQVNLSPGSAYRLLIEAPGYLSKSEDLVVDAEMDRLEMNFSLKPLTVGTTVNLKNVLFVKSKADLLESSYEDLNMVVKLMAENPKMEIELAGHTDNRGLQKYNVKLSQQRVEVVKEYLVSKGIEAKRIKGKGYGGIKPIASNGSEETRKLNRRVEFTIVKN